MELRLQCLYMTKNTEFTQLVQKVTKQTNPYDPQQQWQTRGGGKILISTAAILYYLQCPVSNNNNNKKPARLSPIRTAIIKNPENNMLVRIVEILKPLCIAGRSVKW